MARKKKEVISGDPRAQLIADDEEAFNLKSMAGPLAISGLMLLIGSYIIWDIRGVWKHWPLTAMAVAGAVMLALALKGNPRAVIDFFRSRQTQQGANAFISAGLMLAILVLVNIYSVRHDVKSDWTKAGTNTLDAETQKILRRIKSSIKITYYYGGRGAQSLRLLENYEYYSRGQIKIERVNLEIEPERAKQEGISSPGQVIVENTETKRKERPQTVDEQGLDSAILKVMKTGQKRVCFLKGHGEHNSTDAQPGGYDTARKMLEDQTYKVDTIQVGRKENSLEGCDLLVVAGPTSDLLEEEADAIRDYLLKQKGSALFLIDPPDFQTGDLARVQMPKLTELVGRFGLELQKGIVIDSVSAFTGRQFSLTFGASLEANKHESLRPFDRGGSVVFSIATGMRTKNSTGSDAPMVTPLIESSQDSWCETSTEQMKSGKVKVDPEDPKGPLVLAAAATIGPASDSKSKKNTRVIVVGDSDFASNDRYGFRALQNGRFFQAIINWLVAEEGEAAPIIPPKRDQNQLIISAEDIGKIKWGSMLPPILILGVGIGVWWRRR